MDVSLSPVYDTLDGSDVRAIRRPFVIPEDVENLSSSALERIRAALGTERVGVRLLLTDRLGRLRVARSLGPVGTGRRRAARRRTVIQELRTILVPCTQPLDYAVLITPLASGERTLGVLEVIAPRRRLKDTVSTIEAIATDAGLAIDRLQQRRLGEAGAVARGMADLCRDLLKARDPQRVVRSCVRFCHEQLGVPSAGWLMTADERRSTLVAARGVGARRGPAARQGLNRLRDDDGELVAAEELRERFARVVGVERAYAVDLGEVVLVVGDDSEGSRDVVEIVGSLLKEAFDQAREVMVMERRNSGLDTALASVAHELRGPLLAATAVIDTVLEGSRKQEPDLRLLEHSRKELAELAGLIEPLLRWAATEKSLHRTSTDLVRLVNSAVESVSRERGERRFSVKGPDRLSVRAAPGHLRTAIANVLRNAVAYSPNDSQVTVAIRERGGRARVSVTDEGPGVKASEGDAIFDPFRRGEVGRASRGSQGLGLFIARKVIEAHEGRIWLEPRRKGSSFNIEVPMS